MFSCHVTQLCQQIVIYLPRKKHTVVKKEFSRLYKKVVAYKSFGKVFDEASL